MYEYIKDKELLKTLNYQTIIRNVELRKILKTIDTETIYKLLEEEGNLICYLDESLRDDKKIALESVTYRSFFFRSCVDIDDIYYQGNFDANMLYEVENAYDSLSERLKKDIDIVEQVCNSYKNILNFLNNKENLYFDAYVKLNKRYMIEKVEDFLARFEEITFQIKEC